MSSRNVSLSSSGDTSVVSSSWRRGGESLVYQQVLAQGAYTIYGNPVALQYGDILYIGSIETDGTKDQRVVSWDTVNLTAAAKSLRVSSQDDDHNNAFIAIRPDQSQVVGVCVDHASGTSNDLHFFRSTGLGVSTLPSSATFTHTGTAPTYAYPFINPADLDQLDVITRYGASTQLDWKVLRSENLDGAPPTVTEYDLFIGHYLKACYEYDGSGIWIATCNEPIPVVQGPAATEPVFCQRVALWHLDYATDVISSGGVTEGTLTTPFTQVNGQSANELDYTDAFSNAAWAKDQCSVATSAVANRWGATGVSIQKLVDTGVSGNHRIRQAVTCNSGTRYEASIYARAGVSELSRILLYGPAGSMASHGTDTSDPQLWVNLNDGSRFNATNNLDYWEITDVGNGWYRIGFVFTATDTVSSNFYVMLVNDAGASVYSGSGTGLYVASAQYGETPYADRLMPYSQNLTTSARPSTAVPLVVYDPPEGKYVRLLAMKDVGLEVAFLMAEFDDYNGAKADDGTRNVRILYLEVTKSTWAIGTPVEIASQAVDGSDDDLATGSFTYLGGDIITKWDVLFDQQNVSGAGVNRIVRATSGNGTTFSVTTLKQSSGTDQVMRPVSIQEVTFTGSALRHEPGQWICWMQGAYDGYNASRGGFDTIMHVAQLATAPLPVSLGAGVGSAVIGSTNIVG